MKILYFDWCSIPIFIIILLTTYIRKTTKGASNRLFIALCWVSLFTAIADTIMEGVVAEPPLSNAEILVGNISLYIYFILRNGTVLLYQWFLLAVTRTMYRVRAPWKKVLMTLPYAALVLVLFQNIFTHNVFTITAADGYSRGDWILFLYIVSVGYVIVGTVYLIACRRFLNLTKWIALISMYALSIVAIGMQFVLPRMVVELYSTAIAFLLVILLVLRPEEITDSETGLPSYRAYLSELEKVVKMHQRAQIVVTRFINANEIRTYLGEEVYNEYIFREAEQIRHFLKKAGESFEIYYERPGTFYAVIDDADFDVASTFKEMDDTMRRTNSDIESSGVQLEARLCIIRFPDDLSDIDDIIHLGHEFHGLIADDQMVSFGADIVGSKRYQVESNITGILSSAIAEQRFEMYYQPIYSLKEKKFRSAEALIRLHDSKFGFISPGVFIPAAEGNGLILPIGDFVLDSVYRFISEHDFEELGLSYIEINLSVAQCLQAELPEKIHVLEDRYGVDPSQVNLEITETTYDNIGDVMDRNLKELSERGYTFSLDDYGTGYSNIQRVTKLPLELIKIDKSLVDDMDTREGASIMKSTVRMMQDIDKGLVIEGVETREQLDHLKLLECDYIQGYYFSKPLPEKEFVEFLREQNA